MRLAGLPAFRRAHFQPVADRHVAAGDDERQRRPDAAVAGGHPLRAGAGAQAGGRAAAPRHAASKRQDPDRLPLGRLAPARGGLAGARAVRVARPREIRGLGLLLDPRERAAPAAPLARCARPSGAAVRRRRRHCRAADCRGWHRRAGRPARADRRRAARDPVPPRSAGAGQLPRSAGHLSLAGGRLVAGRRLCDAARARAFLHRAGDPAAALLPSQRPPARGRPHAQPCQLRPARGPLRLLLVQQQLQVHARDVRCLDANPGPGRRQRVVAAGRQRDRAREHAALRRHPGRGARPARLCAARRAARLPGAVSMRRPDA